MSAGDFSPADNRPVPRIAAIGVPHRSSQPKGAGTATTVIAANTSGPYVNNAQGAQENNSAEIVPICIASSVSIATDEFGNKLTTCYYDCFNGESFIRTLRGAVGCIPVRQPR
jgi:hypothetical protein